MTDSKPDFGVPRLKTCVELKMARSVADLSKSIGQIIDDQSRYGSDDYDNFVGVIYTCDRKLTQAMLDDEVAKRGVRLGSDPLYSWTWRLSHGPLASKVDWIEPPAAPAGAPSPLGVV
ncbi:hypothetical protein BH10PSE3_BH10PSE3_36100 [soil metagenome]